jgi:hypothetical protein
LSARVGAKYSTQVVPKFHIRDWYGSIGSTGLVLKEQRRFPETGKKGERRSLWEQESAAGLEGMKTSYTGKPSVRHISTTAKRSVAPSLRNMW